MKGYVDLSGWRVVRASGRDARAWLGDLLTADIAGLASGRSVTSMLLSPTGRIRAVAAVASPAEDLILVQDPRQPKPIDDLLAPYVLSSEVTLARIEDTQVIAFSGEPPMDAPGWQPSTVFGDGGTDVLLPPDRVAGAVAGFTRIDDEELARIWVEDGAARFPDDLGEDSLPHEAEYAHAVDDAKGCYLGQEAVAKVRNRGHPQRLILRVLAQGTITIGEEVVGTEGTAGSITSAAGTHGLASIRWAARDDPLRTAAGVTLEVLGPAYVRP